MMLDVGCVTAGVVLDVRSPVKVRIHNYQASLIGLVKKRPTNRVSGSENEQAARPKHPRDLTEKRRRVGDERERSSCREGEVKRPIRERKPLSISLHHRQNGPGRAVELPRAKKLPPRQVDTHRASTLPDKPAPALAGAAADLYNPLTRDVSQQTCIALGKSFRSPAEAHVAQEIAVPVLVCVCVAVPPPPIGTRRLLGARVPPLNARRVGRLGDGRRLELASDGICATSIYHPTILAPVAARSKPRAEPITTLIGTCTERVLAIIERSE